MKQGYLHFAAFRGLSWVSKTIRFYTRSKLYSHIAVLTDLQRFDLIEAWSHGGGINQFWGRSNVARHTPGTPFEVWQLETTAERADYCRAEYERYANERRPYDWKGIIGFIFKTDDQPEGAFCSEGAIEPIVKAFDFDRITPGHISPADFINIIQAMGARRVYEGNA
jgi:hypothetical protein